MINGIDCASPLTPVTAKALKGAGYEFACRYFGYGWKVLEKAEAQIISDAGLNILCVWENAAEDYRGGSAYGVKYGAEALRQARAINMPESGIIYAAIDSYPVDMGTVAAYLAAFAAAIRPYRLGVYGCYDVVEQMAQRGIGEAYWQCFAWSNGKISDRMTVYQYSSSHTECGVNIDNDRCEDMTAPRIA